MSLGFRLVLVMTCGVSAAIFPGVVLAQAAPADAAESLRSELKQLQQQIAEETSRREAEAKKTGRRIDRQSLADAAVFPKAVEWILRHEEFYKPNYIDQTRQVLKLGTRARSANSPKEKPLGGTAQVRRCWVTFPKWMVPCSLMRLTLPARGRSQIRQALAVVRQTARAGGDDERSQFHHPLRRQALPKEQTWIQLDVFGRTNNAYRFAGETDVFEAIADVRRRYPHR